MKVWIDTDVGGDIDDALALLYAMASKEIEIVGVSTVFQNTIARAKIAKTLLTMGGFAGVPVYAGIGKPRKAVSVHTLPICETQLPETYEEEVFGKANIEATPAVEALKEALEKSEEGFAVATLGALTNLAELIEKYPAAAEKITCLYIMGGAVGLNLNEFNFTCDPESTALVIASKLPKKIVPLDVTFQCALSNEQIAMLQSCQTPLLKTVLRMSKLWGGGMILHDPLTLGVFTNEEFVALKKGRLHVELEGKYSRGKCVDLTDFNWRKTPEDHTLIAYKVKAKEFCDFYVNRVCALDKSLCEIFNA